MIPGWLWALPTALISQYATEYGLERNIVAAIVSTESSGIATATRYEPKFDYLYFTQEFAKEHGITIETEKTHQKTSWGYMQVMGATARELGYKGPLPMLTDPELGIEYGCKYLKKQFKRYGKWSDAIAAYNAGSAIRLNTGLYMNERYVDKVYEKARELDGLQYNKTPTRRKKR